MRRNSIPVGFIPVEISSNGKQITVFYDAQKDMSWIPIPLDYIDKIQGHGVSLLWHENNAYIDLYNQNSCKCSEIHQDQEQQAIKDFHNSIRKASEDA
jgi:hypothetical protein